MEPELTIALWCVLAAGILPLLTVYPAKFDRKLDNRDPRRAMPSRPACAAVPTLRTATGSRRSHCSPSP